MKILIGPKEEEHIFILGAGASVDYGLPTWSELNNLIKERIDNDKTNKYKYKNDILEWLNKTGENNKYKTIDECISTESISSKHHDNGVKIENEIFAIMGEIFNDSYKINSNGWINKFNNLMKKSFNNDLENKIFFINYNYDDVLNKNFLNFGLLTEKEKLLQRKIIGKLSLAQVRSFHPHGHFPIEYSSNISNFKETPKSYSDEEYIDAISCYDSEHHTVDTYGSKNNKLYILGLGAGLKHNLGKLEFTNEISEIHITIKNKDKINDILEFLSRKFELDKGLITVYDDCSNLIESNFDIPF